jgi:hypothetical protein
MGGSQRFCTACSRELKQGARFCTACGHVTPAGGEQAPGVDPDELTPPEAERPHTPTVLAARESAYPPEPPTTTGIHPDTRLDDPGSGARSSWPPSPPSAGASPGEAPQRRYRWPLALAVAALLIAGGAVAVVLILHPFSHASPVAAGDRGAGSGGKKSPASPGNRSSQPAEQQAAKGLAVLLAQSVTDRSSIVSAVSGVSQCRPNLGQDAQTFAQAAASRQRLLTRLASVPERSALPGQMLSALASAWQASIQADHDYGQWAQDEAANGCSPNDQSDPHYQAAIGPDDRATTDKKTFTSLWNPIATKYGLVSYQWNQL